MSSFNDNLNEIKQLETTIKNNQEFINEFVNKKLSDLCFHISLFFFYLSYPRTKIGFKKINIAKEGEKNTEEQDNVSPDTTKPVVTTKMTNYVINEIYNCKNFSNIYNDNIKDKIIYNIVNKVNKYSVKSRIIYSLTKLSDKIFNEDNVVVYDEVEDIILKYIVSCLYNIIYLRTSDETLIYSGPMGVPLDKKFNELQMYVASTKRTYSINYLDNQVQNLSFNSFLHIIISLTDWLEMDDVSEFEVNTALNFILTKDMRAIYKKWLIEYKTLEKKFKNDYIDYLNLAISQIIYIFKKYDLNIDIKSAEKLAKHIFILTYNINKGLKNEKKGFLDKFTEIFQDLFSFSS